VECFVDVFEAMQMMCVNPGYQYKVFYLSILFRMSRGMSMKQGVIATFIQQCSAMKVWPLQHCS